MQRLSYMVAALLLTAVQLLTVPLVSAGGGGPSCSATNEPVAVINADTTVMSGSTVQFGSIYSMGCGDAIVSYAWDFADGTTSTEANPSHAYAAGSWPVSLTVTDEAGLTGTTTLMISVRDTNAAPVAVDDSFSFITSTYGNVKTNDSDPEGDYTVASLVSQPTNGTVTLSSWGGFNYTANSGFVGTDSFTYQLTDEFDSVSNVTTVTLQVQRGNAYPVASDDTLTLNEDTTASVAVLANDTDADGDSLDVTITGFSSGATATVNSDQTISFAPAANANGSGYYLDYQIEDGYGGYDFGRVSITVIAVNDAPVAGNDSATVAEDGSVLVNTRANDSDVDGGTLSYALVTGAQHGTVQDNGAGYFTYRPAANYNGADSFTYSVTDADGLTSTATVSVTVTAGYDAVVARSDSFASSEDQSITGNLIANDTFETGPLTASLRTAPTKGSVTINADGTFVYIPNANANGTDSFTYTVTDGQGSTSSATVSLTIAAVNDGPVASFTETINRRTVSFTNTSSDVDGDALSYSWNFGDGTTSTAANPAHSYTKRGTYTVSLTVTDANGVQAVFSRTITVQ